MFVVSSALNKLFADFGYRQKMLVTPYLDISLANLIVRNKSNKAEARVIYGFMNTKYY